MKVMASSVEFTVYYFFELLSIEMLVYRLFYIFLLVYLICNKSLQALQLVTFHDNTIDHYIKHYRMNCKAFILFYYNFNSKWGQEHDLKTKPRMQ